MTDTADRVIKTRLVEIDPRDIKLLDENARYMTHEQFARLVANVKRDGVLTSAPLIYWPEQEGDPLCLSGNHRTQAAIEADLDSIYAIAVVEELSHDEQVAMQLSHNSINGQDDVSTLKALYESIGEVDMRLYSGLDDKTLELLENVEVPPMSEAPLRYHTLSLLLLPSDVEDFVKTFEAARVLAGQADERWLAQFEQWDALVDSLDTAGKAAGTINRASALQVILEVFKAHVTDLGDVIEADDANNNWVPIAAVVGYDMPKDAAKVLRRAVERMRGREEITSPWQALELLAGDYLAS
jgi:hypothetical protein